MSVIIILISLNSLKIVYYSKVAKLRGTSGSVDFRPDQNVSVHKLSSWHAL